MTSNAPACGESRRQECRDKATASSHNVKPTWKSPAAVAIFLIAAVGGLAGDLVSKQLVFDSMLSDPELVARAQQRHNELIPESADVWTKETPHARTRSVLHEFQSGSVCGVRFTLSVNPGVVFGLPLPRVAVAAATVLIVGLVCVFFATSPPKARSLHLALGFILAGALGNLYDRLFSYVSPIGLGPIERNVRDFIDCADLYYPWIFNIADALLVVGVGLLALHWLRAGKTTKAGAKGV